MLGILPETFHYSFVEQRGYVICWIISEGKKQWSTGRWWLGQSRSVILCDARSSWHLILNFRHDWSSTGELCHAQISLFKYHYPFNIHHHIKTVISPSFLVWKLCWNAQLPQNLGWITQNSMETVGFHKFSRKLGKISVFWAVPLKSFFTVAITLLD